MDPSVDVFQCSCGNRIQVAQLPPGETFSCPLCCATHASALESSREQARTRTVSPELELPGSDAPTPASRQAWVTLPEGTRLGRYTIQRILGQGGMGVVYEAHQEDLDRNVALKVLPPRVSRSAAAAERFRAEARSVARVVHPNVAVIYSIEEEQGILFFTMELVEGRTLARLISADAPLEPHRALEITMGVTQGLRVAAGHGVAHRDIKPSNVMLTRDGQPKVTDFGLAKVGPESLGTLEAGRRGSVLGTPYYMSPEQGSGKPTDHRSDIYSLGVTLFEMLTGRPPFDGPNAISIILQHATQPIPEMPGVPRAAQGLTRWMMAKEPDQRPADYEVLISTIQRVQSDLDAGGGMWAVLQVGDEAAASSENALVRSQLALARTNAGMGRVDKAMRIFRKLLGTKGPVAVEAALQMADLLDREGKHDEARPYYEQVAREASSPVEVAYAWWKLGNYQELAAAARRQEAIDLYRRIMADPDSPFPRPLLKERISRIEKENEALRREMASEAVLIRRAGSTPPRR